MTGRLDRLPHRQMVLVIIAAERDIAQHVGSSVHPQHQQGPHAHSVTFDRSNRFALVCDKGIDKVMIYRLDRATGKLVPNDPPFGVSPAGSAPRHLALHSTRPYVFVINEIASTVTSFALNEVTGALREIQTISTLPADYAGRNSTADIRVHPNGKFVYGSNRGHNSIVAYAVNPENGELKLIGHQGEGIKTPRNFNVDPTGTFLIVANQDGASLVMFKIDPNTGGLKPTGVTVEVANPVCVKFVAKP